MGWTNESENSEKEKENKVIKIQVDRSKELEAKDEQIEDLKAKMELLASTEFNRQADFVEKMGYKRPSTPEELEDVKDKIEDKKHNKNPSGIAPLSGQSSNYNREGYENYGEMLKTLRDREARGDQEAKEIMDKLFQKFIRKVQRDKALPDVEGMNPFVKKKEEGDSD